jgi:hypothetical protein
MYCGNDEIEIGKFKWTADIPEFPTIALPVAIIIGLMYVFQRKKRF